MTLVVHPDYRACLWHWSAAQTEMDALLPGERIYTEAVPSSKVFPLGKITHLSDPDIVDGTHAAVRGLFQFDVWGGSPAAAWEIADTWRSLLTHRLPGVHDTPAGRFSAGLVVCGGISRTAESLKSQAPEGGSDGPDTSSARPRCRFDAQIVLRPAAGEGS